MEWTCQKRGLAEAPELESLRGKKTSHLCMHGSLLEPEQLNKNVSGTKPNIPWHPEDSTSHLPFPLQQGGILNVGWLYSVLMQQDIIAPESSE